MKRVLLFFVFFLCTIQRREIRLIYARESPLAAKFCTKTKTKKTPRPLAVLLLTLNGGGGRGKGGGGVVNNCLLCNYITYSKSKRRENGGNHGLNLWTEDVGKRRKRL
jgi:hypothetical protein